MNSKVFTAFVILLIVATALLAESVLLGGGADTQATQPSARCQVGFMGACSFATAKSCCQIAKPAQNSGACCPVPCCGVQKNAETAANTKQAPERTTECPKSCCSQCDGPDCCCPRPCCAGK